MWFRLITRTLTKYPVDYALYRELLQNSADARADGVAISFQSTPSDKNGGAIKDDISNVHTVPIGRLTVKNNGQLFEEEDWLRLKEIAKGNPNESKIGAFGVGFYSVFDVTDEPLVHSGSTVMSFYYVGDQLRYRRVTLDRSQYSKWTAVDLPYRTPGVMPNLVSFTAFLTQSFMLVPLLSVDLEIDGIKLLQLKKTFSPSNSLSIPSIVNRKSPNHTLELKSIGCESFQVTVKYMNVTQMNQNNSKSSLLNLGKRLFPLFTTATKAADWSEISEVVCFLRKVTAEISVSVSSHFSRKMKETVMKPPPKTAIVAMLIHSQAEQQLSELKPPLSDYVFPRETNDAKIFIGFPTKQSTSMKSHLAMNQLIPTMERTAVDMSNAFVKEWNEQMLYMAGVLSRIVYEHEMMDLKGGEDLVVKACYVMDRFSFQRSTPDVMVGNWIASGFWRSSSKIPMISQNGIKYSSEIRLPGEAHFIKTIDVLPKQVIEQVSDFVTKAVELGFVSKISRLDIIKELRQRTLSVEEFTAFVKWCATSVRDGALSQSELRSVLNEAVVSDSRNNTFQLGNIQYYQVKGVIGDGLPLPDTCITHSLISSVSLVDLTVLGWKELEVLPWLDYVVKNSTTLPIENNINISREFAIKVLAKINDYWHSLGKSQQQHIFELLSPVTCIPTQLGMKLPSESYLVEIAMFPHLPVKSKDLSCNNQFLFSLGLRESVDMAFVLKLLHEPSPDEKLRWSTYDVMKYLTKNKKSLKKSDWDILRTSSFFECSNDGKLYRAHELYVPHQDLSNLGFKTLKWSSGWSDTNAEERMLIEIGLRKCPTMFEVLSKATESLMVCNIALRYYITNYEKNNYNAKEAARVNIKCIPCTVVVDRHNAGNRSIKVTMESPSSCYFMPSAALFGFAVVQDTFRADSWKLGVEAQPLMHQVTDAMIKTLPSTKKDSEDKLIYLSSRLNEMTDRDKEIYSKTKFIPIFTRDGKLLKYQIPARVFLEVQEENDDNGDESSTFRFFKTLFDYLDYLPNAIPFLLKVGVRYRPSITEIADITAENPNRLYRLAGTRARYELFLETLALGWQAISRNKTLVQKLSKAKFLIGLLYTEAEDKEQREVESISLISASEVAIVDDVISFNFFKTHIHTAPQNDDIEMLYAALGSPKISHIVQEKMHLGRLMDNEHFTSNIKKIIEERTRLFLEGKKSSSMKHARLKMSNLNSIRVQMLSSIEISRWASLANVNTTVVKEKISACFDPRHDKLLYLCLDENGRIDWYDLSKALVKEILTKPNLESVLVLETLLSSQLDALRKKGINVDRLLNQKKEEERKAVEKARLKSIEDEEAMEREREEMKRIQEQQLQQEREQQQQQQQRDGQVADNMLSKYNANQAIAQPIEDQSVENASQFEGNNNIMGIFNRIKKSLAETRPEPSNIVPQVNGNIIPGGFPGVSPAIPPSFGRDNSIKRESQPLDLINRGLDRSRPYNSSALQSQQRLDVDERELQAGCQEMDAHDLVFVTRLSNGIACYADKNTAKSYSESELLEARRFSGILMAMARVSILR